MKGLLLGSVLNTLGKRLVRKRRRSRELVEAEQLKKLRIEDNDAMEERAESFITFEGNKAVVYLQPGQLLVFDGCAMVCLIGGKASMLGYLLTPGVQVLVSSDAKLCSSLTFEAWHHEPAGCKIVFESHYFGQQVDQPSFLLELRDASQEQQRKAVERTEKLEEARGVKRKTEDEKSVRNIRATILPSTWWVAIDSISRRQSVLPPIVPICGAKSSGKSTFGRFLVNRLLESHKAVAYLDTDVGQPEFTVPGCLSLHILEQPVIGSPVLHIRDPERCYFYGDISAKTDPEMYLRYIVQLYDYFRQRFYDQGIPLIINTAGWTKGFGYDLLVDILRYTVPSHVLELGNCELPPGAFWDTTGGSDVAVIRLSGVSYSEAGRASDLRALRVLSYFQRCFGKPLFSVKDPDQAYVEAAEALASHVPYEISVDAIKVFHLHTEVPASQTLFALNAQIVGLGISSQRQEGGIVPCIGLAVIRAVDVAKGVVYVLTPCPLEVLQDVDMILHGKIELPAGLLKSEGYVSPYLCRLSVVEGTGTSILRRRKTSFKRKIDAGSSGRNISTDWNIKLP